ncbi:U2 snRNP complex subunit BUD31 [Saccharomyces paradoxus]|uniref:U2 snRNP complex subunit BUD31 n=1 Tax=Saccharomyces paradoxus TaxID=27291 RepID=A0A8B8UMK4_SACPA|nr:Bud31 [Saccharomyces paradoxus]QHS71966.1 Bud31 [Saccharomyces paradoxus]
MPRIKTRRSKPAPDGFEKIKPTLTDFEIQLRDAQKDKSSKLAAKATEQLWEIMQLHHQRSRYIYTLYYKRKAISKDLYDWLVKEKYADRLLIAKWRKTGYEKLCCLRCIQKNETNNGSTCICRVPRAQLEEEARKKDTQVSFHQCVHCGCRGCASTD